MIFSYQSSMNEYASILQPNQMNKIKNVFDIDDIKKILESQSKPNAKRLLLILDDVLHSTLLLNNKLFLDMIANSRHYNIYTIITMQYPLGITPELRVNFGFVFIFQDNFISNKKRIYEHYFGMFSQFKLFDKIMSEYCEDYGILVADNLNHSTSFEDKVKWYKSVNVNNEYIHQIELLELDYTDKNSDNDSNKKNKKYKRVKKVKKEKTNNIDLVDLIKDHNITNKIIDKSVDNDILNLSDNSDISKSKKMDKNTLIEKIKKNNKLIKKITKQNEKLYKLL